MLEELAIEQPIARAVLEYRQSMKLRSTYVEALPRLIDPATGRIHAQFNQTVAATGRLSSSDPNLQNIPVRTPLGRRIRQAFTAAAPGGSAHLRRLLADRAARSSPTSPGTSN